MVRNELVKRSPLRILEQSTHGGLGKGNVGVIAAPKGVGKTACLVHLATDQLLEGKHVIHVSFASDTSHIIAWYEDIFEEISNRYNLDSAMDVHDDIIKHRVIMNFRQDGVSAQQVQKSMRLMIEDAHFHADAVFIDGYDFSKSSEPEFASFKRFAEETGIELWFSASTNKEGPQAGKNGVPPLLEMYNRYISVLIVLEPCDTYISLNLVKDHETAPPAGTLHLKLDPHILLIAEDAANAAG